MHRHNCRDNSKTKLPSSKVQNMQQCPKDRENKMSPNKLCSLIEYTCWPFDRPHICGWHPLQAASHTSYQTLISPCPKTSLIQVPQTIEKRLSSGACCHRKHIKDDIIFKANTHTHTIWRARSKDAHGPSVHAQSVHTHNCKESFPERHAWWPHVMPATRGRPARSPHVPAASRGRNARA